MEKPQMIYFSNSGWRPVVQGNRIEGYEEASSEESALVRWSDASGSAGLQAQGQHGHEIQPEAGEEGGQGGGEYSV